ncbi:MAG: ATP-binding protein [bacterium]|nr:ATP-binding protein [bacterium]
MDNLSSADIRKQEGNEQVTYEQMLAIMANVNGGVSAVVIKEGHPHFLYANNQYFEQLGYTREQFLEEVDNAFDLVYEEDRGVVAELTRKASIDKNSFSCEYRARKRNGRLVWMQSNISITSLPGIDEPVQLAVANSIDQVKLQLRQEIINHSVISFQINLTKGTIEEYYSRFHDIPQISPNERINEDLRTSILKNIVPEDRDRVVNTIFYEALARAYSCDLNTIHVDYRRYIQGTGVKWLHATANIMERPHTGELVAFVCSQDIDVEKKNQLAIESIMDEEIEYVLLLNTATGQARMVQEKHYEGIGSHQVFHYDDMRKRVLQKQVMPEDSEKCELFFDLQSLIKALDQGGVIKQIYRVMDSEGRIQRKKARAFYLDSTREEIVLIRRDITDLYEEEQRQKQILQDAVDAAVEANHAKSDFLSRMSHDMRTPLNAILSFSDHELTEDATEEKMGMYLDKIHASGDYLLGIINDVLDVSKIEQDKMALNPTPYSLDEFTDSINTVIGSLCQNKSIDFNMDISRVPDQWIMIDKVRFNQIFINLLSNAVKFTEDGGKVDFTVMPCSEILDSGLRMRFEIRDNGIGMSPEFLPHAFDSFSQEYNKNISEKAQGTGLGLTIVKEIVSLMKGTISVESKLGKGTLFTVELPLKYTAPPPSTLLLKEDMPSLQGIHVLLCEDNELNREIAVILLEKWGCQVECAENGRQGMDMFLQSEVAYYDVILMDIRMPVMNGLEATKGIRAADRPDAPVIPIVAMTADAFSEDAQISSEAGMNGHLSKPIEPKKVFETLMRVTCK